MAYSLTIDAPTLWLCPDKCPEERPKFGRGFVEEALFDLELAERYIITARFRSRHTVGKAFQISSWLVQPSLNTVSCERKTAHLEPKVMEVLVCLAEHAGETIPKEKLIQTVWPDTFVTDDVLTRSISELRRVFEDDAKEQRFIQTIPKRGYRLVAPVMPVNGVSAESAARPPVVETATGSKGARRWRSAITVGTAVVLIGLVSALSAGWIRNGLGWKSVPVIHSLAVLPLQNLTGDPNQEYFADGMTDGLISELSQIGSVRVISRTSVMRYKKTDKQLPEIARELNVDGIIEGTVQRSPAGDRVRITAQLLYAPAERHVWADTYERDLKDVFSLQRDVTQEIASQIRARLVPQSQSPPPQPRPVNLKAFEAYLQGKHHLDHVGQGSADEEADKAAEYFRQAIDADPSFLQAYVGLVNAYDGRLLPSREIEAITKNARKKIVEIAPNSSLAAFISARAKQDEWDWTGAEAEFRRAIALDPNNADAHSALAQFLDWLGRFDEGWKEWQEAQELNPNPDRLPSALDMPEALAIRDKCDKAVPLILRIVEANPKDGQTHLQLSDCYYRTGRYREEIEELGKTAALYGQPEIETRLKQAYAASGYQAALRQWARELEQMQTKKQLYMPSYLASVYGELGEKERALYWLEEAYNSHMARGLGSDLLPWLKTDPRLQLIRNDPRYFDLLRRVKLSAEPTLPLKN